MKLRNLWMGSTALAVALALVAGSALAQQEKKPGDKPATTPPAAVKPTDKPSTPATKPGDKPTAGQPSAEEAEMMKKMAELATPGEFHRKIEPLIGTWNCAVKFTMAPGAPPEESSGTLERKWVMDGRYMFEEYKGTAMEQPFTGRGYLAYDNGEKKYISVWMDSMGTGIFYEKGTIDPAGKTITFTGENFCCMTDKLKKTKSTLEIVDNSKQILRMFDTGPDGKEFQSFEMIATRK
jgi:hypothetical protein